MQGDLFERIGALSDTALLDGLSRAVVSGRRNLAELVAHLCEVEDRRLHLAAGYSSMFAYCTGRLGFSEDEAYRRIEVARLARRAPVILTRLAEGRLSLSAAALLKPHLWSPRLPELVDAVSDASVQAAREALAVFSPRPDVAPSVRKLPGPSGVGPVCTTKPAPSLFDPSPRTGVPACPPRAPSSSANPPRPVEPLSSARFKVQFTADAELRDKLMFTRDLMRHAIPSGDLAAIIRRALDLLITDVMKHRFGARSLKRPAKPARKRPPGPAGTRESRATPGARDDASEDITRPTRRIVAERDGLQCTWRGADGTRCTARAWLEYDHRSARGLGGASDVENVRLLCRNHNQYAAEHVYGRHHIEEVIRKKKHRDRCSSSPAEQ